MPGRPPTCPAGQPLGLHTGGWEVGHLGVKGTPEITAQRSIQLHAGDRWEAGLPFESCGGWGLTLARLAVNSTHSKSSPIRCRNSSTWGRFST